jgi:hypothetical protein
MFTCPLRMLDARCTAAHDFIEPNNAARESTVEQVPHNGLPKCLVLPGCQRRVRPRVVTARHARNGCLKRTLERMSEVRTSEVG